MDYDAFRETLLFRGLDGVEIQDALKALQAEEKRYGKGATILSAGVATERMGLVLEGGVTVESNDFWGNRSILSSVGTGGFFAETYALLADEPMLVDVAANEDCRILFLHPGGLRTGEGGSPAWKMKLLDNLLHIFAEKNLHLSGRSFHISPKGVRDRVLAYLNSVAIQKNASEFDVPFDRQQLADYLNVERTALSKELGRMRRDGVIEVRKSHFRILRRALPGSRDRA